jgi:Uncharacterized protein conserved in bacteria
MRDLRLLLLALLLGLAACTQAPPPVSPVALAPTILNPDAVCLQDLSRLGVAFQPVDAFGDAGQGCAVANPVNVSATGAAWNRPSVVSCAMARTLARYQAEVLEPLARRHFGQDLKRIHHAGTYACRIRRNNTTAQVGSAKGGRLSEHSKGQAIDIMAFELADGTTVSVKRDWRGAAAKSSFLRDVAKASCGVFNVVLTPNYDRFHQDHLHLDIGPYALCGS